VTGRGPAHGWRPAPPEGVVVDADDDDRRVAVVEHLADALGLLAAGAVCQVGEPRPEPGACRSGSDEPGKEEREDDGGAGACGQADPGTVLRGLFGLGDADVAVRLLDDDRGVIRSDRARVVELLDGVAVRLGVRLAAVDAYVEEHRLGHECASVLGYTEIVRLRSAIGIGR
jgi:hypothetical protein